MRFFRCNQRRQPRVFNKGNGERGLSDLKIGNLKLFAVNWGKVRRILQMHAVGRKDGIKSSKTAFDRVRQLREEATSDGGRGARQ